MAAEAQAAHQVVNAVPSNRLHLLARGLPPGVDTRLHVACFVAQVTVHDGDTMQTNIPIGRTEWNHNKGSSAVDFETVLDLPGDTDPDNFVLLLLHAENDDGDQVLLGKARVQASKLEGSEPVCAMLTHDDDPDCRNELADNESHLLVHMDSYKRNAQADAALAQQLHETTARMLTLWQGSNTCSTCEENRVMEEARHGQLVSLESQCADAEKARESAEAALSVSESRVEALTDTLKELQEANDRREEEEEAKAAMGEGEEDEMKAAPAAEEAGVSSGAPGEDEEDEEDEEDQADAASAAAADDAASDADGKDAGKDSAQVVRLQGRVEALEMELVSMRQQHAAALLSHAGALDILNTKLDMATRAYATGEETNATITATPTADKAEEAVMRELTRYGALTERTIAMATTGQPAAVLAVPAADKQGVSSGAPGMDDEEDEEEEAGGAHVEEKESKDEQAAYDKDDDWHGRATRAESTLDRFMARAQAEEKRRDAEAAQWDADKAALEAQLQRLFAKNTSLAESHFLLEQELESAQNGTGNGKAVQGDDGPAASMSAEDIRLLVLSEQRARADFVAAREREMAAERLREAQSSAQKYMEQSFEEQLRGARARMTEQSERHHQELLLAQDQVADMRKDLAMYRDLREGKVQWEDSMTLQTRCDALQARFEQLEAKEKDEASASQAIQNELALYASMLGQPMPTPAGSSNSSGTTTRRASGMTGAKLSLRINVEGYSGNTDCAVGASVDSDGGTVDCGTTETRRMETDPQFRRLLCVPTGVKSAGGKVQFRLYDAVGRTADQLGPREVVGTATVRMSELVEAAKTERRVYFPLRLPSGGVKAGARVGVRPSVQPPCECAADAAKAAQDAQKTLADAKTWGGMAWRQHSRGLLVRKVVPDGPAHHAGLQVHDVITHIDGQPQQDKDTFAPVWASLSAAQRVPIQVIRSGPTTEQALTVTMLVGMHGVSQDELTKLAAKAGGAAASQMCDACGPAAGSQSGSKSASGQASSAAQQQAQLSPSERARLLQRLNASLRTALADHQSLSSSTQQHRRELLLQSSRVELAAGKRVAEARKELEEARAAHEEERQVLLRQIRTGGSGGPARDKVGVSSGAPGFDDEEDEEDDDAAGNRSGYFASTKRSNGTYVSRSGGAPRVADDDRFKELALRCEALEDEKDALERAAKEEMSRLFTALDRERQGRAQDQMQTSAKTREVLSELTVLSRLNDAYSSLLEARGDQDHLNHSSHSSLNESVLPELIADDARSLPFVQKQLIRYEGLNRALRMLLLHNRVACTPVAEEEEEKPPSRAREGSVDEM